MKVKELIAQLLTMDQEAEVRIEDTYTRNEGWLPGHEIATCSVSYVVEHDGIVEICDDLAVDLIPYYE